jgi:hypothetical protein
MILGVKYPTRHNEREVITISNLTTEERDVLAEKLSGMLRGEQVMFTGDEKSWLISLVVKGHVDYIKQGMVTSK